MDRRCKPLILAAALSLALGCGNDETSNNDTTPTRITPPPTTSNTDPGPGWVLSDIDTGNVGFNLEIVALGGGTLGVAYYDLMGTDVGPCVELGEDPPSKVQWNLYYAEYDGASWQREDVATINYVGSPPGLDLQVGPNGQAQMSAMIGEFSELHKYCGANDAGLLTRMGPGNWMQETVAVESSQAPSDRAGSNFGEVVGYWTALAFDMNDNPAVVYKDVHAGSLQSIDLRVADLEMAWRRGGAWEYIQVLDSIGAGNWNQLLFDDDNNPVVFYYNPIENPTDPSNGVFARRSLDGGINWEQVRLFNNNTERGLSAQKGPDGTMYLLYYQSQKGFPQLATLVDPNNFASLNEGWTLEDIGNSRFDEGYGASLAIDSRGNLAAAYYRCTKSNLTLGRCESVDDALVFAYKLGDAWEHEIVDEGDSSGRCGESPSLSFDDQDRPVIAYRCEALVDGSRIEGRVKFARRGAL